MKHPDTMREVFKRCAEHDLYNFFLDSEELTWPAKQQLMRAWKKWQEKHQAKEKAACLFRALTTAANPADARAILDANGFVVQYVEQHWGRRFTAAFLDGVRLIDNVPILETKRS